jgi:hypothetical protein
LDNINSLLVEINLPASCFDNALEALLPSTIRGSNNNNPLKDPCNLVSPTDKNDHITDNSSPTGVDTLQAGILSPTNTANPSGNEQQQTPSNKGVRINETAVHVELVMMPAGSTPRRCKSILHSSTNTRPPDHEDEDKVLTTTTTQPKEIHDCSQKLFRVFSNDGMEETSYHVIDFAGLYPIWPIVEFSMSPTGNTKDKRMSSFTKCVTTLLSKMLYIDSKAMIAPIAVTDDDSSSYISSKANIPTNFTILGKHIMISGGSWVLMKRRGATTTSTHASV